MKTLGGEVARAFHWPMDEARRYGIGREAIEEYAAELNDAINVQDILACADADHQSQAYRAACEPGADDWSLELRQELAAGQAVAEVDAAISIIDLAIKRATQGE